MNPQSWGMPLMLYTSGHSNRPLDEFLALLEARIHGSDENGTMRRVGALAETIVAGELTLRHVGPLADRLHVDYVRHMHDAPVIVFTAGKG